VVGTPGSGTRVFARLAEATGRHMGAYQSEGAKDALALFRFAGRWCRPVYSAWSAGETIAYDDFAADLRRCIEDHLSEAPPGAPWGWKQPRSLYMLPALHAAYPELRVVHVIRDGRDVAFSAEPNVELSRRYVLRAEEEGLPEPVRAAIIWDRANRLAADFGEGTLGERYLRLSLEQACADPEGVAARLGAFAGGDAAGAAAAIVRTPASLGRWRSEDAELVAEIAAAASVGLRRFGYLAPPGDGA
jgi:Sulfotransferase family